MIVNKWYTFKSAGEKIGKSHSYFYSNLKRNPSYFKEGTYRKDGHIWLISDEGIEHVVKSVKKEGVHQRIRLLCGLESKREHFAFTLKFLF